MSTAIRPDSQTRPAMVLVTAMLAVVGAVATQCAAGEPLSFNRDIRPILSEHCWKCHGFDEGSREGGLRLDQRESAVVAAESGAVAIAPNQPSASELMARVTTEDDSYRMPPSSENKRLTPDEIQRLKQWIAEGAPYQRHWAFEPIVRPRIPDVDGASHPIDAFVAAMLREHDLTPSPEAERDTLIRRVYFDLIGMPPTAQELQIARREPWERTVDRLLASPHFGERMAVDWLDAARYADTDGYFGDKPRQMWLWRDWVIEAFNRNLPFDQFTIEQLAGDLLPNATISQRIATGFNRNHMSNDETGIIAEEYRVETVADRVDTTMSTWLGLTIGCARCHDHKYDPITQREYYRLFAFFNNVPETGLLVGHDAPPRISVPSPMQTRRLAELEVASTQASKAFAPLREAALSELTAGEEEILTALPPLPGTESGNDACIQLSLNEAGDHGLHTVGTPLQFNAGIRSDCVKFDATRHLEYEADEFPIDGPWTLGLWLKSKSSLGCPISKIEPTGDRRGIEILWQKGRIGLNLVDRWGAGGIEMISREKLSTNAWHHVVVRYDGSKTADGVQLFFDGQPVAIEVRRDSLAGTLASSEPIRLGRRDEGLGFYGSLDEFRWVPGTLSDDAVNDWFRGERIRGILQRPSDQRTTRDTEWLLDDHIDYRADENVRIARKELRAAENAETSLRDEIPLTLVMEERAEVRPTYLLERGAYDQPGEQVQPGTPAALSPWPVDAPNNRLGFAQWLVSPDNPLMARVAVNRLWKQCFGNGLVRTVNDFGTQGEPSTHPELLDYLADEFRQSGWDTKALLRLIVTSRTYQQASRFRRRDGEPIDPENRLLARGPRFRLPMEMIRDQALATSGLLVPMIGGPSVMPFQPPGLWEEVSYDGRSSYEVDSGPGRHRRSVYTFIKRQAPPPALLAFDGPTRETCTLTRPRTNTPLQALVLLNDVTYLEAARRIATTLCSQPDPEPARIAQAVRIVLTREPTDVETSSLARFVSGVRERFAADPDAASQFVASEVPGEQAVETATWTVLVHTLFNLDEAITRR